MLCSAASQAGNKPATSAAAEAKTEPVAKSTEPVSDTAAGTVKQDSSAAAAVTPASEPVASAEEAVSDSKEEKNEEKAVVVEDSDKEDKMDTSITEQNKAEEAKEEVSHSFISLVVDSATCFKFAESIVVGN